MYSAGYCENWFCAWYSTGIGNRILLGTPKKEKYCLAFKSITLQVGFKGIVAAYVWTKPFILFFFYSNITLLQNLSAAETFQNLI